jgi:hypothetical protein
VPGHRCPPHTLHFLGVFDYGLANMEDRGQRLEDGSGEGRSQDLPQPPLSTRLSNSCCTFFMATFVPLITSSLWVVLLSPVCPFNLYTSSHLHQRPGVDSVLLCGSLWPSFCYLNGSCYLFPTVPCHSSKCHLPPRHHPFSWAKPAQNSLNFRFLERDLFTKQPSPELEPQDACS